MGILITAIHFWLFLLLCGMGDTSDKVGNTWMSNAALYISAGFASTTQRFGSGNTFSVCFSGFFPPPLHSALTLTF